jgi:hypothetical protein
MELMKANGHCVDFENANQALHSEVESLNARLKEVEHNKLEDKKKAHLICTSQKKT